MSNHSGQSLDTRSADTTNTGASDSLDPFRDILQTIRSRKVRRPKSNQSSLVSTSTKSPPSNLRGTPSVELDLSSRSEETDLTLGGSPEEYATPPTPTEEELHEARVRNLIRERMHQYRNKKKAERKRILEERKAAWIERQKRLGMYVEPLETGSQASGSIMSINESSSSGMTDDERRKRREERKRLHKLIPLPTVVSELRKNLQLENNVRSDLLETIRIIRGVKKEEFYEQESPDEELEEEEEEEAEAEGGVENGVEESVQELQDTEKHETEKEEKPKTKGYKGVRSKIDSRWPKGHKHHTVPVKGDWSFLNRFSAAELTSELACLIPEYMRDVERIQRVRLRQRGAKWLLPRSFKTKRIQRNLEFESWREEMMRIAYDEEFARGKSRMFSFVPLPRIHNCRNETPASRTSQHIITSRTESTSRGVVCNNEDEKSKHVTKQSPYTVKQKLEPDSKHSNVENNSVRSNENGFIKSTHSTIGNIYKPVGKSVAIRKRSSKSTKAKTTYFIKNKENSHITKEEKVPRKTSLLNSSLQKIPNGTSNRTKNGHVKSYNIKNLNFTFRSERDEDTEKQDAMLSGDNDSRQSTDSVISTSNHLSPHSGSPRVTTITVYFKNDSIVKQPSDKQNGKQSVSKNPSEESQGSESSRRTVETPRILIKSPINREERVMKLFHDIQSYRRKHPTVENIKIQIRNDELNDMDWILKYVKDASHDSYTAVL